MDTDHFFQLYYEDTLRIHAICDDLELSRDDAKLYSLIHLKCLEKGEGTNYFRKEQPIDVKALEIMLGEAGMDNILAKIEEESPEQAQSVRDNLACLRRMDAEARQNHGLESPIFNELCYRKRLYTEEEFREEKLKIYETEILPRIPEYDDKKVEEAFKRAREREKAREEQLRKLFD